MPKSLFASKTFWVGLLGLVVSVSQVVSSDPFIAGYPKVAATAAAVFSAAVIGLRLISDTPVKLV